MSDFSHSLGCIVKEARIKKGLTQAKLAEKISIDNRTIINIENGRGNPKLEILYPLIRVLEIDPCLLFFPDNPPKGKNRRELDFLLQMCSEEELKAILPVCEALVKLLRSKDAIPLE